MLWWLLTGSGFWGLLSSASPFKSAAEANTMLSGEDGDKLAATWLLPFSMPTCIKGGAASVTDTWAVVVKVVNVGLLSVMVVVALALSDVPRELLLDRLLALCTQRSKDQERCLETCSSLIVHGQACFLIFTDVKKEFKEKNTKLLICHCYSFQMIPSIQNNCFLTWLLNNSLLFKDSGQLPAIFTGGNLGVEFLCGRGSGGGHSRSVGHLIPLLVCFYRAGTTVCTLH